MVKLNNAHYCANFLRQTTMNAEQLIQHYQLSPLPEEGGYYRRVYTHPASLDSTCKTQPQTRALATAIYFLITRSQFSAMHRIDADEVFHFYQGHPAEMLQLHPDGRGESILLGDVGAHSAAHRMARVPQNSWQGLCLAKDAPEDAYAFFGVSVHPGFLWKTFELADKKSLIHEYLEWKNEILMRTNS